MELSLPASTFGKISGLSEVQLPSAFFVKVTFSGISEVSLITVTSTVSPTCASSGTFTVTEPSVVDGVTCGALGAVVSGLFPAFAEPSSTVGLAGAVVSLAVLLLLLASLLSDGLSAVLFDEPPP